MDKQSQVVLVVAAVLTGIVLLGGSLAVWFFVVGPQQTVKPVVQVVRAREIRLQLVTSDGKPITNTKVTVMYDDGKRCIQAPCPSDSVSQQGTTDSNGSYMVPRDVFIHNFQVIVDGYTPQTVVLTGADSYTVVFDK